jgi:hypothetical protein
MKAAGDSEGGEESIRHELEDFLEQDQAEIAAEYERIFRRSTEDPGTAGDQGEENWAELLRQWLPPSYHVVTKGRILFPDGTASPQIDVLVLRGTYPLRLLTKKLYLSSGVVAAFECKNTLIAQHIATAASTAALLKSRTYLRQGTVREELHAPPVYGLLAHSHSWKSEGSTPIENVDVKVAEALNGAAHPSELFDIICVADLAAWTLVHLVECPWTYEDKDHEYREFREKAGALPDGDVMTGFFRYGSADYEPAADAPNPVAVLVAEVLKRLAWDDPDLIPLADYFRAAGITAAGTMETRIFPLSVFSDEVQERLRNQGPSTGPVSFWDPWSAMLGGPH